MGEGKKLGEKIDNAASWATNQKRVWLFILGAIVVGAVLGIAL